MHKVIHRKLFWQQVFYAFLDIFVNYLLMLTKKYFCDKRFTGAKKGGRYDLMRITEDLHKVIHKLSPG